MLSITASQIEIWKGTTNAYNLYIICSRLGKIIMMKMGMTTMMTMVVVVRVVAAVAAAATVMTKTTMTTQHNKTKQNNNMIRMVTFSNQGYKF